MKFLIITKQTIITVLLLIALIASASVWLISKNGSLAVFGDTTETTREIEMVTTEYKTTMENGEEMEVYRWDPGTVFLEVGEKVNLNILGVMGKEHSFYIEGTDIKGVVQKGEETKVPLHFDEKGTYQLICHNHSQEEDHGKMIAYIVVQ